MKNILFSRFFVRFFLSISVFWHQGSVCEPIITLFVHRYPGNQILKGGQVLGPATIKSRAKQALNGLFSHGVAGIFATYGGYLDASDAHGQIVFPRKQSSDTITLFVCRDITPVLMFENTVDHLAILPGKPAKAYEFVLQEDQEHELTYWVCTEQPIPEDRIIPRDAIVLISKPSRVYVPTGATMTEKTANLMLPNLYVKKGIKVINNALFMLYFTQWFRPTSFKYEKKPTSIQLIPIS